MLTCLLITRNCQPDEQKLLTGKPNCVKCECLNTEAVIEVQCNCKVNFIAVLGYFLFIFYFVRPSANGHVYFLDRIVHVIDTTIIPSYWSVWHLWSMENPGKSSLNDHLLLLCFREIIHIFYSFWYHLKQVNYSKIFRTRWQNTISFYYMTTL